MTVSPDGFLSVIKPSGVTSFDVIRRLKPLIGRAKIGHAGVIDKPAKGVLPLGLGGATKLFEELSTFTKEYFAWLAFGATSPTLDLSSKVEPASPPEDAAHAARLAGEICGAAPKFTGDISQVPPTFSNVKIDGKELYRYGLSSEAVEVAARRVNISRFDILRFYYLKDGKLEALAGENLPENDGSTLYGLPPLEIPPDAMPDMPLLIAEALIECSTGTYVRALARDVGATIGCGGLLASLIRTRVGPFRYADSIELEMLAERLESDREGTLAECVSPMSIVVRDEKRAVVHIEEARNLSSGNYIIVTTNRLPSSALDPVTGGTVYALLDDGRLVAKCGVSRKPDNPDLAKLNPIRVFLT